jgi:hypothetical protein
MPNGNLKVPVTCPQCGQSRLARGDVVRKADRLRQPLWCKPCRNKDPYNVKSKPKKGTGVKNDPDRLSARASYYKAQRRCRLGEKHHPAYKDVEFRFESFEQFYVELGPRPDGCSLDRIDTLGHYEPGNVRWATTKQQAQNRMPKGYWVDRMDNGR